METGARIERGKILSAENGSYIVASLDREGIETLPIRDIQDHSYTVGGTVYFFLFADGTGRILCEV